MTRELIAEPFRGHKERMTCLAISPDGLRIVSGSSDQTLGVEF
jgi:WD40 repeat protein